LIATDITNGPHELVLRFKPEAIRLVRSLRIYRPPLRTNEMFTPPPPPKSAAS
jgi:hypothetical protein